MRPKGFHKEINQNLLKSIIRVSRGSGWKKINKCPICSSAKYIFWLKKYNQVINKCLNCDTGFTKLIPKDLNDVYNHKDQFKHHQNSYEKNRYYRIKRFGSERVNLLKKFKKKGKLVDIGCGNGWFLEAAKKNFFCSGLEFNKSLAQFTEQKLQIPIHQKIFELDDKSYDIITLFDVIEHVEKPIILIKNLTKKLKKGGIILIYTPNKNSAGFDYMRENQNLVIPPYHLTYFCSKSFKFFPRNLKIIYEKTFGLDIGDIYAYERDVSKKTDLARSLKKNANFIQGITDRLGYGNHIRLILKKI